MNFDQAKLFDETLIHVIQVGQFCNDGSVEPCLEGTICTGGNTADRGVTCDQASECLQSVIDGITYGATVQVDCPEGNVQKLALVLFSN